MLLHSLYLGQPDTNDVTPVALAHPPLLRLLLPPLPVQVRGGGHGREGHLGGRLPLPHEPLAPVGGGQGLLPVQGHLAGCVEDTGGLQCHQGLAKW